ncbi:MAG: molybdenum cofactor guanylyltransferase [Gemmatimonadetes bacterium]|nr:molybdenum cofactor guanylyltransferase [Gemmatimonadota bacterium]
MRGAVLAGGTASRFDGRPKGLEKVGGERILDRVVRVVATAVGAPPLLVANAADAPAWNPDLKVTPDRVPNAGSLGGIYTAVVAGEGPVLVVAWDMPFVPASLLEALVSGSNGFDVFLPDSGGRRGVEPLCGVYGPACGPAIRARIDRGDLRAIGFHESVRVGTMPRAEVARHGDIETMFFNVNTARELERAEVLWERRA